MSEFPATHWFARIGSRTAMALVLLGMGFLPLQVVADPASGQVVRLPQLGESTNQRVVRLPRLQREWVQVRHAGGAVRLQVPPDWDVREIPVGRELRLVLKPASGSDAGTIGPNSPPLLWLTLRYRPTGLPVLEDQPLVDAATNRLLQRLGNDTRATQVDLWRCGTSRWARIQFETRGNMPSIVGIATPGMRSAREVQIAGTYWMQQVAWGRLEMFSLREQAAEFDSIRSSELGVDLAFGSAAEPRHEGLTRDDLELIVSTLVLVRPLLRMEKSVPEVQDAQDALGLWKSSRSLMRLSANGRITIISDQPFEQEQIIDSTTGGRSPLHPPGGGSGGTTGEGDALLTKPQQETTIVGHYTAQDDLLFTVWEDSSKLNYRWKLHRGDLLLTDHHGRTSKLWRIAE